MWRAASGRIGSDVRVVLEHSSRQVTADRLENVIGHTQLGELSDNRVFAHFPCRLRLAAMRRSESEPSAYPSLGSPPVGGSSWVTLADEC